MSSIMSLFARLSEKDDAFAVIPGAWDSASIRQIGDAGMPAALLSGEDLAASLLGERNEGVVSPSELAAALRRVKERPSLPVIADAQSGFGNQLTAHFVVRDLIAAGADGILINDQAFPSRSEAERTTDAGLAEFRARLRAAREACSGAGVSGSVAVIAQFDGVCLYGAKELAARARSIVADGLADFVIARVHSLSEAQALSPLVEDLAMGVRLCGATPDDAAAVRALGFRALFAPLMLQARVNHALTSELSAFNANATNAEQAASATGRFPSDSPKACRMRAMFKEMCFSGNVVPMVVAPDALSARIAESVGYRAIFSAGYATSAARLAKPDRGIADFGTMVDNAREVINAVNIPVFVDGDTGYGDEDNIARMIHMYENLGAAGVFIEDQVWPKRCGHMDGKSVVSAEEGVRRVAAAAAARRHDDFLIMSRTDAYAQYGLDEAIKRTRAYHEAGADLCFIEAPQTREDMERIPKLFTDAPLMANMIESGKTPLMSDKEIHDAGYTIAVHPCGIVYTEAFAVHRLLENMRRAGGDTPEDLERMIAFPKFNEFIGLGEVNELEKRFAEE